MKRNTLIYFSSYAFSLVGNGIATVMFPLLVLAKTGNILYAGILASTIAVVGAVIGVFAGVVVDRMNRRTVSIVSDLLSAASVAALPIVDSLWGLNLSWFIALGVIGAFGDIPGMTARETMLPRLMQLGGAKPGALERLVGTREAFSGTLLLLGPGIGGLLVLLLGVSSVVLFVTAGTSLCAAAVTCLLSPAAGEVTPRTDQNPARTGATAVLSELAEGWRFLLGHRFLLSATILTTLFTAVTVALQTTILPAYFTTANLPQLSGFALTGFAIGGAAGAGVYAATANRISRRSWFVVGMAGTGIGFVALGALASPWSVMAATVFIGITSGPMSAVLGVATIEAIPDHLRGRVLSAQNTLMLAAPALSTAPIAAIASGYGLAAAGWTIAAVVVLGAGVSLWVRSFRFPTVSADTLKGEGHGAAMHTREGE